MFPMLVTVNNAAQLSAVMAALGVDQINTQPVAAIPAETAATTEAKPTTVKKEKKAEPAVEHPKAEVATTEQPKADTTAVTYQDASKVILKLSAAKGRDTAVALLSKFGAANLKEVKPEQYAAVMAAANEALGA